jgi:outer membrane protein
MNAQSAAFLAAAALTVSTLGAEPWTLERALGFAVTNSPDTRIALQRVAAAQAGLDQANSAVWPRLTFQTGYTRTDNPMLSFGHILNQRAYSSSINFNDVPDTDNLNVRGLLGLPLYTGGRIASEKRAARADSNAARQEAEIARQALAAEVTRAFFITQKTRQFVAATEAAVTAYETNVVIATQRFDAGTALRTDVLDLEVQLAQAREDLIRARNANTVAQRVLQNLLGIDEPGFTVADSAPTLALPLLDVTPARPEAAAAAERTRAAEANVQGAKSGYLPRVTGFGSLDYDRGWVTDGHSKSYTAGVLLQWDWWDGWLTRSKVNEAAAHAELAREQERKTHLAIQLETEQARLDLEAAHERLEVGQRTVARARESLTLTTNRFAQGLALASQVIDAQTALTGAQVRQAEAEADLQIATALLRRALGLPILETAY